MVCLSRTSDPQHDPSSRSRNGGHAVGQWKSERLSRTTVFKGYSIDLYPKEMKSLGSDCEHDLIVVAAGVDVVGRLLAQWQQQSAVQQSAVQVVVLIDQGAIADKKSQARNKPRVLCLHLQLSSGGQ
jgi:hypothetical protein